MRAANSSGCSAPYSSTIAMAVMGLVGKPDAEPTSNSVARLSISTVDESPCVCLTIAAVSVALDRGEETIHAKSLGTEAATLRACARPEAVSGESTPCPAKMPSALAALSPCLRNHVGTD